MYLQDSIKNSGASSVSLWKMGLEELPIFGHCQVQFLFDKVFSWAMLYHDYIRGKFQQTLRVLLELLYPFVYITGLLCLSHRQLAAAV